MEDQIGLEELLAALWQTEGPEGRGLSAEEISQRIGRSVPWVRKRLHALQAQGRLAPVQWRSGIGLDGRLTRTPVYSLRSAMVGEGSKEGA